MHLAGRIRRAARVVNHLFTRERELFGELFLFTSGGEFGIIRGIIDILPWYVSFLALPNQELNLLPNSDCRFSNCESKLATSWRQI